MRMRNFNRTDDNPVFLNSHAKGAIRREAKRLLYIIENGCMDVGMDYEDAEGEMFILWCEHCSSNSKIEEEGVVAGFEKKAEWYRMDFVKKYYSKIEGRSERGGVEPFDPDFYQFSEMYRNGCTIDELAEHYQVSVRTIKTYMQDNYITKVPIDPVAYLDSHEKIHGRDSAYWNIRSELITRFEID